MNKKVIDIAPYLADIDIEIKSKDLLSDYFDHKKSKMDAPIPVIDILEYLGYDIDFRNDGIYKDKNVLGGLIQEDKKVQLNEILTKNHGRLNFTVAHEIGHIILHVPLTDINLTLFRKSDYCDDTLVKKKGKLIETQADKFAAFLIMPSNLIKNTFFSIYNKPVNVSHLSFKDYFFRRDKKKKAFNLASQIIKNGNFNNVSKTAMINRLLTMKLIKGLPFQTQNNLNKKRR